MGDARIESFSASTVSVSPGGDVLLAWRAVNTDTCFLQARVVGGSPGGAEAVPCEGSVSRSVAVSTAFQFSALRRDRVTYETKFVIVVAEAAGTELRNVVLASLGATTGDNGHFDDGVHTPGPSADAIDDDPTTYWGGLAGVWPQIMWVNLDRSYRIGRVGLQELDVAFVNTGLLEYFDGSSWRELAPIDKVADGLEIDFAGVDATAVRLTVYSNTSPDGWYNQVACVTAFRVYAIVDDE